MLSKELVKSNDPILKQKTPNFDFSAPPVNPVELYRHMANILIEKNALGLAANQLGLPYRFFVLRAPDVLGCFNPKIVDQSEEMIYLDEGCLSFPGILVKIKRAKKIRARFTLPNNETVTQIYDGMTARCFQHELAHLDGRTMKDDANRIHWDRAQRKKVKL